MSPGSSVRGPVSAAVCFTLVAVAAACATNPVTGRRQLMLMSEQEEIDMGRKADADVRKSMGVYNDAALQQYVSSIGLRLARASHRPNLPWTFTVVDVPAVNAFALPGGFIYITRGILPFLHDESQLAAVLGHEVGHVDARHSAAQVSQQQLAGLGLALGSVLAPKYGDALGVAGSGLGLVFLKFGREHELEADRLGTTYTAANGWDPGGMPGLLETLAKLDEAAGSSRGVPNWALTHPPAADRVARVQESVAAARTPTSTQTNRAALEQRLDGVVFGDSREKGMIRGREFVHPVLRFALTFPAGWDVANTDDAVMAQPAGNNGAGILLQLVSGATANLADTADASMARSGLQPAGGRPRTINGLAAYVGRYEGVIDQIRMAAQAGFVRQGTRDQVYRIVGLAPSPQLGAIEPAATATIESFRQLSQQEADGIQDDHIAFRAIRSGDTWTSLAAGSGRVKPATLAIMNGFTIGSSVPGPGSRVRIIQ